MTILHSNSVKMISFRVFFSRYFKVLVQELDVKMDKIWLMELVALFGSENQALDVSPVF